MSSEDEFREILGDKLNERNFSFDASSWEQAREMIDAAREKEKKRPFFWIISGGLLLIGGILTIFILNTGENKKQAVNDHPSKQEIIVQAPKQKEEPVNENPLANRVKTKTQTKVAQPVESRSTKSDGAVQRKLTSKTEPVRNDPERSGTNAGISVAMASVKTGKIRSLDELQKIPGEGYQVFVSIKKIEAPQAALKENQGEDPGAKQNTKTAISIFKAETGNPANVDSTLQKAPEILAMPLDSVAQEKEPATVVKKDSLLTEVKTENAAPVAEARKEKNPEHFVSAEGGLMYLYGWQNPSNRDANGYNPYLGIHYSKVISEKMTLGAGIAYYSIGHLSYSNKTSVVTKFGLGEENAYTVITPAKLHYLSVPFRATWAYDKNNIFGAAYNFSWLMSVDVKTKTYNTVFGQSTDPVEKKDRGYTQGFNPYDHQLALFYRRRIFGELFVHTEIIFGLSDIKNNGFFAYNNFERNMGVRCTLFYQLFKK